MLTIKQRGGGAPHNTWLGPAPWIETPPPGPQAQNVIDRRHRATSDHSSWPLPLVARRAHGTVVEDVDGNRYLDFAAGLATCVAGHTNNRIVTAIEEQAQALIQLPNCHCEVQTILCERLAAMAPGAAQTRVLLTESGNESVEAAVKLARRHTGRHWLIAFTNSYHGWTIGAATLTSTTAEPRQGFGPLLPKVLHSPYGQADAMVAQLARRQIDPGEVAAVLVKPVSATDGFVVPPADFLPAVRRFCDEHEILLVVDEICTGMGRTGHLFACEHFDVVPDAILLGESLAAGMPIGALIARADVLEHHKGNGGSMFGGGNPVSCAAAIATLDLIEHSQGANTARHGDSLRAQLGQLSTRHRCLTNVRGLGLMAAVDAVKGGNTPSRRRRDRILDETFRRGVLLSTCGKSGIQFSPPLCINETQLQVALQVFEEAICTVT
jgi:4-aminobutyrate aminotransferase